MNYFDGITFITQGDFPHWSSVMSDKFFDGYYGIQYNHRGRLDFSINDSPITTVEGPWAFISHPDAKFYYGAPPGEERHHSFICFRGERVDRYIESGLLPLNDENPLIKIVNSKRFIATLQELYQSISIFGGKHGRDVWLLEDALLQLHEQPQQQIRINEHLLPLIDEFVEQLTIAPQRNWIFEEEAARMNLSYSHFRRLFKELCGCAPGQFLLNSRLKMAADLLLHSDEQIRKIAELCGFNDEYYFSRIFKKHMYLSPFAYRREFKS